MTTEVTTLPVMPIVSIGRSRHGHQYGESATFRQWITDTLTPLEEIQAAFFELLDIDLDTAEGVKLDLIGRLVGAPALIPNAIAVPYFGFAQQVAAQPFAEVADDSVGGYWREVGQASFSEMILSSAMYRQVIRAQIIKNSSLCTPPDIISIARMLIRSEVDFAYVEYPMRMMIAPRVALTRAEIELLRLMLPRPCGVGIGIINGYFDDFGFKDQAYSLPMGETDDASIGGYWTSVREDIQEAYTTEDITDDIATGEGTWL